VSEQDTTASSMPEAQGPGEQVETTEEALESRGQLGRDYLWNTAASLMSSLAVVIMGVAIMRSGATYLSTRLLTCLVMVGLILSHSWSSSTKDPYPAFTVIAAMALLRIFDAFEDVYYSEFQRCGILWECLPLFIAAFLNQYLANAPRFAIHANLGDEQLGVFAIIYMPAVAINMLSLFVFRPLLTRMALRWTEGKRGEFFSIVRRGLLTTALAFVLVALVTYFIGAPLLTLVFGTDVSDYVPELMVLVLGGALNAAGVILYYALATMRRLRAVLVAFLIAGGTAYVAAAPLVRSYAMMGASLAYASTMALLAILFVAFMLIPVRNAPIETESVNG